MLPHSGPTSDMGQGFVPQYLKRAVRFNLMDFEFALSQMVQLCFAPQTVFRASKHRKLTKNHWSRDDPAFVVLQVLFLVCATVAYLLAFSPTVSQGIRFIVWEVLTTELKEFQDFLPKHRLCPQYTTSCPACALPPSRGT
eukprot:EG_transcript_40908